MKYKKYFYFLILVAAFATLSMYSSSFAQGKINNERNEFRGYSKIMKASKGMMRPVIVGTVTSINGNSLTISSNEANNTSATYTVDATNANIVKNNTAGKISDIAVGDSVSVVGTLNGTNITATYIRDGILGRGLGIGNGIMNNLEKDLSGIVGNGEPLIAGTVSAVNGNSISITNKSNIVYTVDATNAKVLANNTNGNISSIAVGDTVLIQGNISGNAVTASTIIDSKPLNLNNKTTHPGFFFGIGSFFKRLFGF